MLCPAGDNDIRRRLFKYTPGSTLNCTDHGFQKLGIQLFGMTGHGKSSLINSCLCVGQDRKFMNEAGSGHSQQPITMERKEYKIKDSIYITDNRGLVKLNDEERQETAAQFSNVRDTGAVSWERVMERTFEKILHGLDICETDITLPVFVYSAECPLTEERSSEIVPLLLETFHITEIFPIVVLTKTAKVKTNEVAARFKDFGANYVISLENYTTTNEGRNPEMDTKILKFLDVCMSEADRMIEIKRGKDQKIQFIKGAMKLIEKEVKTREKNLQAQWEKERAELEKRIKELENKCSIM
ncbi:uncharacterized protein LOC128501583 [Spea bombifrons]|uniref:uncharacterized protein LOC128501583 n=1 Tax=Spea bombifrons TaxID=233779 RepID=UPI00234B095B|nr:uncharacterized protein LOC128501583 [Spea bombifrons]